MDDASRSEYDEVYSAVYDLSTPLALNYGAPGLTVYKVPDDSRLWGKAQAVIDEELFLREAAPPFTAEEETERHRSDEPTQPVADNEGDSRANATESDSWLLTNLPGLVAASRMRRTAPSTSRYAPGLPVTLLMSILS